MSNIQLLNQELPDFLQQAGVSELTKTLAGKVGIKRLVPKNGIWTKVVGGESMGKLKGDVNVIIVNAAPRVGRIFYAKAWSPDAEPTAPDCFSNDGRAPDAKAANPQASACDSCPQNIKGSGQGQSKACRYSRRIAVMLEDDFNTSLEGEVYQINLASKSLFGDGDGNNAHTFENYTKYLSNNGKSVDYMVTRISFNENNDNQSVLFAPARYINKHEFGVSQRVAGTDLVKSMIVMTPGQADGAKQPALAAPVSKPKEPELHSEPTKRASKKDEEAPSPKKKLADVVAAWSDEE